jgi:2-keto-4-pentenoate hydratase
MVKDEDGKAAHTAIAERLLRDHDANVKFRPFAAEYGIKGVLDAYAVQREYIGLKQARSKSRPIGYKIGATSRDSQALCGVDTPMAGVVLSDAILDNPTTLYATDFGRLALEFEILLRIGKSLPPRGRRLTVKDVAACVDGACVSIEIFDDRRCDYVGFDMLSLIADNGWNAGILHSTIQPNWPDLATVEGVVLADGAEIGRPVGQNCLGHPFNALTWLANHLADTGAMLQAGDIVSTGTLIKPCFPSRSTRFEYRMGGLGQVSCQLIFSGPN